MTLVESRPLAVLVVDDDMSIQTLVRTLLERARLTVDVASDGAAALQLLAERDYDAIVLDLMMPGTNGFEVLRHLREGNCDLLQRVIVATAAANRPLADFDSASVRKLVRKPFDIHDLVAEVISCGMAFNESRPTA